LTRGEGRECSMTRRRMELAILKDQEKNKTNGRRGKLKGRNITEENKGVK
jgi:hypothetical protein